MKFLFKINPQKYNLWSIIIQSIIFGFAVIIILKLVFLQIIQGSTLKEKAGINRSSDRDLSFRGEIFDRNGIRLAGDTTLYDIYAHPRYYKKENTPDEIASVLAKYLNQPEWLLKDKLSKYEYSTISLAKNVDTITVDEKIKPEVLKRKIRGLDFVKKSKRIYPQGNLAAHILGYINFDANLAAGVERTGESSLASMPKTKRIEYDGRGNVIYDFNTEPENVTSPLKGSKLVLTIDSAIQHVAEIELAKMIKKAKADKGAVIALNPKNGEILGFALYPNYDPNNYNVFSPSVIKNWALSDVYPPGSTFKVLTIASALETGAITKDEKLEDTGKIKIQGWEIKNYDYNRHPYPGIIDLEHLFMHSSNIGSLKAALKMSPYDHYRMLRLFGIGMKTGIDLPGESAGIIPEANEWEKITQASIAFGYSIAATPVQIASAVAAIANNGVWITPHVMKTTDDPEKIKKIKILSEKTCQTITDVLSRSIEHGSSEAGKIKKYRVAGKSGTSRKPDPEGKGYLPNQIYTSFIGYFPAKNPEVLIMVVIDNPKTDNSWGSTVAGPVFNAVALEVGRILNIEAD
ncbi:MAG TPA: penicillin-binding protein 2 [Candidatus Gastranaerophilales bacterium]|nr:penicillin-binding protein 2 [Candidatus Gastranaerophilales bacterium]